MEEKTDKELYHEFLERSTKKLRRHSNKAQRQTYILHISLCKKH